MKKTVAILLAFICIFSCMGKLMLVAGYQLNKQYIANNLCENKQKPQMHCNGKCHLSKELYKEAKRESTPANSLKEVMEILLYSEEQPGNITFASTDFLKHNSLYTVTFYNAYFTSIYHPPWA